MPSITLTFPFAVMPHQSVRMARGEFYQPIKIKHFKISVGVTALKQLPDGFKAIPSEVPIRIHCHYNFTKKSFKASENPQPKVTKPDITDNCNKALIDSLAGILFEQDQQIYFFSSQKWWAPQSSITVKMEWDFKQPLFT